MGTRAKISFSGKVGLVMIATYVFLGVFGPWLAPHDPSSQQFAPFLSPSGDHWLGTDPLGNDTLSQMLAGARSSLTISLSVVSITALVGVFLGSVFGFLGGWWDEVFMRIVDIFMAFPGILLNIAVAATVAKPGISILIIAMCANGWVGYARIARGQVLTLREREYVVAARALGIPRWRILLKHIIPNLLGPIVVQMSFAFGTVILIEASLTFLGLGPQDGYSWGELLRYGNEFLIKKDYEYFVIIPGMAIMWVVLGANLLGDGLVDWLDPKKRSRG